MENDATILGNENLHGLEDIIEFSYSELQQATSNFHESNIIGKGGFGAVYRGKLRGIERAIKILHKQDDTSQLKAYEHEVNVLSMVKHQNIVRLIGTCPEKFVVVYELMSGGNLHYRLPHLYWEDRLRIATEICSVLYSIHNLRPEILVHGDLKPENILLDDNLTSKLCDFGISRLILVNIEKTTIYHTTDVKGTQGYLDPAFAQTRHLAPSSDVYSFGMLLLRLVTKERVGFGLIGVVKDAIEERCLRNLLDNEAGWPYLLAEELSRIALHCCNSRPKKRPDLTQVHKQLEEMKHIYHKKLITPKVSYAELERATSYFSESNLLRIRDFGRVYKGNLRDTEVAIELLTSVTDEHQENAFFLEVNIMGRLEHPNLVHLIGVCPEKFALVYEFIPETLEDRLERKDLLWKDRLRIATEVCTALVYLHSHEVDVLHGCIKPSSVLLDTNGVSKLDGAGTFLLLMKYDGSYTTKMDEIVDYLDPAFVQSRQPALSQDVYSFGCVLLRLLTNERAGFGLISMVEDALEEQHLEDLLDDAGNWPYQLAEQLSNLALRCCDSRPKRRPNTAEVLEYLEQMKQEYLTS